MKNLFENWLLNNEKPERYVNTIRTISDDLKKVNYQNFDLYLVSDVEVAKKIKQDYLKIDEYASKNDRGNSMYSSALDRYIEFLSSLK